MNSESVQEINKYKRHLKVASNLEARVITYKKILAAVEQRITQLKSIEHYCDSEQALLFDMKYNSGLGEPEKKIKPKTKKIIIIAIAVFVLIPVIIFSSLMIYGRASGDIDAKSAILAPLVIGGMQLFGLLSFVPLGVIVFMIVKGKKNENKTNISIERLNHANRIVQSKKEKEVTEGYISIYENTRNEVIQNLNIAIANCQKHYQYANILPPKYRYDFCAVSTMYEYLDIGICVEIQGPYGIFTRYEDDKYKNLIISELNKANYLLSQINDKMDVMINNQNTMIELLEESNRIADKIYKCLTKVESNTARTAEYQSEANSMLRSINERDATRFYFG